MAASNKRQAREQARSAINKWALGFASVAWIPGAPLIGSKVAHSVLDFVPVFGWAAKSVVAAGVTKAVGEALISYFNDCSNLSE
ncbi:MAG: hypothetical protein EAZ96_24810 [Oscillatoriales cyanobacterium]|nr:MAG: hypothetical protein EAZ96_24810 [Oscillatoriales cyanobacterium]